MCEVSVLPKYSLVISGTIGAGKSTLIKRLLAHFHVKNMKCGHIPEYIDTKNGPEMLEKWTNGEITLEEFQEYINGVTEKLNKDLCDKALDVKIYERTPIESAIIFSIESPTYENILNSAKSLHERFAIPNPCQDIEDIIIMDANLPEEELFKQVATIVQNDMDFGITKRILYLRVNLLNSLKRIKFRGRRSEKNYSVPYLQKIFLRYEKLFI